MTDSRYFEGVKNQKCFNRQQVLQSFRNAGYKLSDASFYKRFASMVKDGDLARVGNGLYPGSSWRKATPPPLMSRIPAKPSRCPRWSPYTATEP